MGQKVNPHGLRVGVIKDWDSRWYARNEKVGDLLVEDKKIRDYLKKTLYSAGIPKIEIERDNAKVRIYLHCARPGVVIGKGGEAIEALRAKAEGQEDIEIRALPTRYPQGAKKQLILAVTGKEVAAALSELTGTTIDKKKVELETRDIKEAGVYNGKVRLYVGVVASFKVNVEVEPA